VNATGAIILFIYLAMAVAQIRLRRRMEAAGEQPLLPMWGFPVLSYAAIVGMVAVLVAMVMTPTLATQFWASALSVAVVLLAYQFSRPTKGKDIA
jgi:AAT family amino acid transporter/GABA permease